MRGKGGGRFVSMSKERATPHEGDLSPSFFPGCLVAAASYLMPNDLTGHVTVGARLP